jgi:hypothetical protein
MNLTLRPASGVARTGYTKSPGGSVHQVTPTELPTSRTVAAAADGSPQGRYHSEQEAFGQQQAAQDCMLEAQTREVIYRSVEVASAEASSAGSKDAALKLRAYGAHPPEPEATDENVVAKTA